MLQECVLGVLMYVLVQFLYTRTLFRSTAGKRVTAPAKACCLLTCTACQLLVTSSS